MTVEDYPVERVPMPARPHWARTQNPISARLRGIEVGESIVVKDGDPNWRLKLVENLNHTDRPKHWFVTPEEGGRRIFRDK